MRSAFCAELPTAPTRHEAAAPDLPRFDLCVMNMRQHLVQVACELLPIAGIARDHPAHQPSGNGMSGQARWLSFAVFGGLIRVNGAKKSSRGAGSMAALTASSNRSNSTSLGSVDADDVASAAVCAEPHHHAGMGRARDCANDDEVEFHA